VQEPLRETGSAKIYDKAAIRSSLRMKKLLCIFAVLLAANGQDPSAAPQFTAKGELIRPQNYREWIYLSSGVAMNYGTSKSSGAAPAFDNVFVTPASYRSFLKTGTWPDKTMFILEIRSSATEGSINKAGSYQTDFVRMEAEVKDEARFPGKWGFFPFNTGANTSKQLPTTASCYSCHAQNGAVDNTFVQFYPTLLEIAKRKGTLKVSAQ
jgi:hypothetical protein